MNRLSRFIGIWAHCAIGILLLSCTENKDLQQREVSPEVTTGRVIVTPQWGTGLQPEALRYVFYPAGNASGQAVGLDGTVAGCEGDMPAGTYRVLAYNTGVAGVRFAGLDSYGTAAVELIATATRTDGLTLVGEPSQVYAATVAGELTVVAGQQTESSVPVRSLMHTLVFNFTIGNGFPLNRLGSTLCGVYPSVLLATGEPTQAALQAAPGVAIRFAPEFQSATGATAEVCVPGLLDPRGGTVYNNVLALDMTTTDDEHYTSTVDLNSALTEILADNGGTLPVEVPVEMDIRVERTAVGLSTTVAGWQIGETTEGAIH